MPYGSICAVALDMFPSETRFISYRNRAKRVYIEFAKQIYRTHEGVYIDKGEIIWKIKIY